MPYFIKKSPQVVKHVVKCEKWACSTLEAGKNKPIIFIAKTRVFKRFCEEIKEKSGILRLPIFGTSVHNRSTERQRVEVVETYSQSTENACVYKEFCNTKGI